jgi:hypothetical protein
MVFDTSIPLCILFFTLDYDDVFNCTNTRNRHHINELYQERGQTVDRKRFSFVFSKSIILEFIFRPRARKLIMVDMKKLSINFICIVFFFYSGL